VIAQTCRGPAFESLKREFSLGRGKGREALGWVVARPTPALRDRCRFATTVASRPLSLRATPPKEGIF
jgi:hypothetical protein